MAVEALMTCGPVVKYQPQGTNEDMSGREVEVQQHDVELSAFVGPDPDDPTVEWSVWTPTAKLTMTVMNAEAARYFEPGAHYRVTITKRQPQQARA